MHRFIAIDALHARPGVVLGACDDVERTGTLRVHVTFAALLVQRIQLEQRRFRGCYLEQTGARYSVLELAVERGSGVGGLNSRAPECILARDIVRKPAATRLATKA